MAIQMLGLLWLKFVATEVRGTWHQYASTQEHTKLFLRSLPKRIMPLESPSIVCKPSLFPSLMETADRWEYV